MVRIKIKEKFKWKMQKQEEIKKMMQITRVLESKQMRKRVEIILEMRNHLGKKLKK